MNLKNNILKYRPVLAILAILIFSLFLRLYHLGFNEFWYDEIGSIGYARYPWGNWNAPLYWILLHYWVKIFGVSEFSLRFPSLIFSFFSVILLFFLGKHLFNKKAGLIACIFMGLSPFCIWYAQEARDYSMALFFGVLSTYLLFKAIKEKRFKLWMLFTLISIIGLYTNYFFIFLLLAQGISILFFRGTRPSFKEIICFLIIALGFSLYLPRFLSKFYYVWQGFWVPTPSGRSLFITLENYALGYNGFPFLYFMSNILAGLFFISALWAARKKEVRRNLILCIFLFSIPITCAFCFSKLFFSVYLDRGLIIFSPYFYIALALGAASLNKALRTALLAIFITMFLIADYRYFKGLIVMPIIHHTGAYVKKPIKPVINFLEANLEPQDIIVFTHDSVMPSFEFYSQKALRFPCYYFFDPKIYDANWKRPVLESKFNIPLKKIQSLDAKRIWVIYSSWARDGKLDDNSQSVKDWLDKKLKLEFLREFEGILVARYIK